MTWGAAGSPRRLPFPQEEPGLRKTSLRGCAGLGEGDALTTEPLPSKEPMLVSALQGVPQPHPIFQDSQWCSALEETLVFLLGGWGWGEQSQEQPVSPSW